MHVGGCGEAGTRGLGSPGPRGCLGWQHVWKWKCLWGSGWAERATEEEHTGGTGSALACVFAREAVCEPSGATLTSWPRQRLLSRGAESKNIIYVYRTENQQTAVVLSLSKCLAAPEELVCICAHLLLLVSHRAQAQLHTSKTCQCCQHPRYKTTNKILTQEIKCALKLKYKQSGVIPWENAWFSLNIKNALNYNQLKAKGLKLCVGHEKKRV